MDPYEHEARLDTTAYNEPTILYTLEETEATTAETTTTTELVQTSTEPSGPDRPFFLHLYRQDQAQDGHFTPAAQVGVTPALRTSGLVRALPAEDLKSLLLMLTFVTANGSCRPSVVEMAAALHIPEHKVRSRMKRLCEFRWQRKPLVQALSRENGLDAYVLSDHLVTVIDDLTQPRIEAPVPIQGAGREAVIAYSRAHYARPREEVEREIAQLNGWPYPAMSLAESQEMPHNTTSIEVQTEVTPATLSENAEVADVVRRLLAIGVKPEQTDWLLARFDLDRIRRQIGFLPYRNAKHPAAFLLAAIEQDYEPPRGLFTEPPPMPVEQPATP